MKPSIFINVIAIQNMWARTICLLVTFYRSLCCSGRRCSYLLVLSFCIKIQKLPWILLMAEVMAFLPKRGSPDVEGEKEVDDVQSVMRLSPSGALSFSWERNSAVLTKVHVKRVQLLEYLKTHSQIHEKCSWREKSSIKSIYYVTEQLLPNKNRNHFQNVT